MCSVVEPLLNTPEDPGFYPQHMAPAKPREVPGTQWQFQQMLAFHKTNPLAFHYSREKYVTLSATCDTALTLFVEDHLLRKLHLVSMHGAGGLSCAGPGGETAPFLSATVRCHECLKRTPSPQQAPSEQVRSVSASTVKHRHCAHCC